MFGKIPLTKTLTAVADSCEAAERALRAEIQNKHEAADEELITRLFHGELKYALRKASEDHLISRAFERDVATAIGGVVNVPQPHELSIDLFAESRFHKRSVESKTGGDFGLLIVRPSIRIMSDWLEITMAKQGLLCQAKLKHGKKWDSLTDTQKKLLKNRTSFLSLVLYSYSDNQLSRLNPIEWQSCNGSTVKKIGGWLKADEFPSRSSSSSVIHGLGSGTPIRSI